MAIEYMLSTDDNPYNPFTEWDSWLAFDEEHGYYTSNYISRVTYTSYDLSDEDNSLEINRAVEEAVKLNIFGRPEGHGKLIKVTAHS